MTPLRRAVPKLDQEASLWILSFTSLIAYEPSASWDTDQEAFRFAAVSISFDLGLALPWDKTHPHSVRGGDRVDSDHSTNTDEVIQLAKSVPVRRKLAKDVPGSPGSPIAARLLLYYASGVVCLS